MRTVQRFTHRLAGLFQAVSINVRTHWHHCPRCDENTPWIVHAWQGYYRCLRCGTNPVADDNSEG